MNCGHLSSIVLEADLSSVPTRGLKLLPCIVEEESPLCEQYAFLKLVHDLEISSFYVSSFTKGFIIKKCIPLLVKLALEEISPVGD